MADSVIRVALLGAGRHSAATHGPALREIARRSQGQGESGGDSSLPRVELAAVCDLDEEKARQYAREFGFRATYRKLSVMVADEKPDALFLITPLALTEKIASEALPFRIPLLIEKPPGATLEETERLLDLARRTGSLHMVSFNRRFNPAFMHALKWIAAFPEERAPLTVVARMLRHNRREKDFAIGTGIHLIDAVLALMGAPETVETANSSLDSNCHFFNAHLTFSEDRSASILIAPACGRHEETLEAHGEEFALDIDFVANRFRLFEEKELSSTWTPPDSVDLRLADVIAETEHFLRSLKAPSIHPNLADGLISMRTANAIQKGQSLR